MTRQYLSEAWNDYAAKVLPRDAPAVQRTECRRAFFSACAAMLGILNEAASKPDDEQTARMMADVAAEILAIGEELSR